MSKPLTLDQLPPSVHAHVDPATPAKRRAAAARGLLPLSPVEVLYVQYQAQFDEHEKVRAYAEETLKATPANIIAPALKDMPAPVLDYVARSFKKNDDVLEAITLAKGVEDETILWLARGCSESISELIAGNEVRALRTPGIIEALYQNANTRNSTTHRLVDLARRNEVSFDGLPALRMLVGDKRALSGQMVGPEVEVDASDVEMKHSVSDDLFSALLDEGAEEDAAREAKEAAMSPAERRRKEQNEQKDQKEERVGNRTSQIDRMNIADKVRLATLGSKSDREYLIRNPNRLVHMAAVTGPKVNIKDIISWAGNKSMPDGVIRYIAGKREFRRNYQILLALTQNPKTPLSESIGLLNHLHQSDLVKLSRNRTVPHQLQRAAKRLNEAKQKRKH